MRLNIFFDLPRLYGKYSQYAIMWGLPAFTIRFVPITVETMLYNTKYDI